MIDKFGRLRQHVRSYWYSDDETTLHEYSDMMDAAETLGLYDHFLRQGLLPDSVELSELDARLTAFEVTYVICN